MANKYLSQFPAKTTPVLADILYVGDSANSFSEVQSTIGQVITNNKIITTDVTPTTSNIPVWSAALVLEDSGIAVDHAQNITNVNTLTLNIDPTSNNQAATKHYADLKLAIASNLSDLNNAGTARTNLGLGNAAVKGVSDNTKSNVASTSGSFTTGHVLVAADSSGTVSDGGATSQFFKVANNLSEGVAATMRSNLGLGTAATKNSSSNTATVASVSGSTLSGNIAIFSDSGGTVQDSGNAISSFLLKTNNLSDVANTETAFDNISPLESKGDLLVYNGSTNTRLPGSVADRYVLTYDTTAPQNIKWAPASSPLPVIRVISTTTVLTSADFGSTIVCQGSSSYTVTLPAASAGVNNFIYFVVDTSSNALVTVASSNNINGQASVKLGLYDGMTVMSDGSKYLVTDLSLYPVALQAYASTQQTITSAGSIQLQIDTPIYDVGSSLNTSTWTVTPVWPGKYEMFYQFLLVAPVTTCFYQTKILFNNSISASAYQSLDGTAALGGFAAVPLTYITACNGSTDNFTFTASQQSTSAASQQVNNNQVFTYVQMKRISLF